MSDVPLKEHIEAQIKWLDKYFESQIQAIREAVDKAEGQLNKRLEGMNEFRDTLKDQAGRLATKDELKPLDGRLKLLELRDARIAGMAAAVALIVSAVIALVARLL